MGKLKISIVAAIAVYALLAVFLSPCGRTESADEESFETVSKGSGLYYKISAVDYYASGMHYKVFNSVKGSVFVVNVTKDSLEVAKNNRW